MLARLSAILLLCLPLAAQQPATTPATPPKLTIESIFAEGGITGRGPDAIKWSPDSARLSFIQRDDSGENGQLWSIDVATGAKAVLVAESKLQSLFPPSSRMTAEQRERAQRYAVAAYQWAPDSRHLLFDSRGQLWYYSLDSGTAVQLTTAAEPSSDPKFSPDGKRLAYVRKHDLWSRLVGEGGERQVTRDGDENLLNGEVDWLYEEELAVHSNYFWSPDSKRIAFLQMNEKPVPTYPLIDWMPTHPKVTEMKYPKAGDPNPEVRLGVTSADGGKVKWISLGDGSNNDVYIPRFGWVGSGTLYALVVNRLHTRMDLYFADAASGRSRLVLTESEPNGYLDDERFHITWLKSGDRFLWPSWRDGHMHLYLYSFDKNNPLGADAKLERQLTKGEFEVSSVDAVNESIGTVYFTANRDDPRQQNLYSVSLNGGPMQAVMMPVGTNSAKFAPNAQYFVDNWSALISPPRLAFCKVGGACNTFWQARPVAAYNLLAPRALELKAADGQTTLYGYLLLPPGAETMGAAGVPVILNPYGGPGGQVVRNLWGGADFLFHNIMARRGFAILQVDNRGMANRGRAFATPILHHLGKVELEDQLAALDQVLKQFPALDPNRVGWWGWSYGGYMTLYAMTHTDRVKAGVSVAPVSDWRDYDSTYTERYMGLPKDNVAGYAESAPVNAAKMLAGRLLEVHGTSDDNVHLQNTMQMVRAMINAGKQFDLQLYPGKTHGISGADRTQLYHRIQHQFEQYLLATQPAPPRVSSNRDFVAHAPSRVRRLTMGSTAKNRKYSYRRNLPHIQKDSHALFVTFRTYEELVLPPVARDIVLETCLHEHRKRIDLHGVVVMPTHVHMVFTPLLDRTQQAYTLAEVLNAIKSVSAHKINHRLFRNGHVWQDESFDHVLQHNESIDAKVLYLMANPVAAGLVRNPLVYKWLWRQGVDDVSTRGGACATPSGE